MQKRNLPGALAPKTYIILIILPLLCLVFGLCMGRMTIPLKDILVFLKLWPDKTAELTKQVTLVLKSIRLPRLILAAVVGAGLSVAGCVFQAVFSNPLATPDTLGVASGTSFGAALALLIGLDMIGVQITALIFGLVAVTLTLLMGNIEGQSKSTPILAGIMIGSLFSSLISLVKFTADTESQLPAITYWLMGSLETAGYSTLLLGVPPIIVCIVIIWLLRWQMNLLPLSEDEAITNGVDIKKLRLVTEICATVMTASCVSMCGQVGWVGLIIPHICRMLFGSNHLSLIPAATFIGASFMIVVDTAARTVSAKEIPISVLTAIIGAPFFIWLLRKNKGWSL